MEQQVLAWISHYGYLAIFFLLVFGIVGLPIPDETLLTFTGYLLYQRRLSAPLAFACAFAGSASGIGDVFLRGKYTVHQWERAGVAVGVDVRLPTGDALNFLGSGAVGVKPFGVFSYRARITPHALVGYEINGSSTLAGSNIVPLPGGATPVSKASLPNRLVYVVGADVRVTKRLTGAFDIYGQRLFSAPQLVAQSYTDLGKCADLNCTNYTTGSTHPDLASRSADISINDASVGLKLRLLQRLVATGNVLIKIDDGGLRSRAVPLVGLSYGF